MTGWRLWTTGEQLAAWGDLTPRLACWEGHEHPAQRRMQAYLDDLATRFAPFVAERELSLHLEIDREREDSRFGGCDLENYLTPIVHRLGPARFVFVSATKRSGGGHRLALGRATRAPKSTSARFEATLHSSTSKSSWKAELHAALLTTKPALLPEGPVTVRLAWRCSPKRNWVALWKPTGDAMGPVLGEDPRRPFNPRDDRIDALELHSVADPSVGWSIGVAMWWRSS